MFSLFPRKVSLCVTLVGCADVLLHWASTTMVEVPQWALLLAQDPAPPAQRHGASPGMLSGMEHPTVAPSEPWCHDPQHQGCCKHIKVQAQVHCAAMAIRVQGSAEGANSTQLNPLLALSVSDAPKLWAGK